MTLESKLQKEVDRTFADRTIEEVVVRIEREEDGLRWAGAAGNLTPTTPFFVASTTKLYTAALLFRLAERGEISLEDRLVDRLDPSLTDGLHVLRGVDSTGKISLRHLLSQTSGLPDYFSGKRSGQPSLEKQLRSGFDQSWTLTEVVEAARSMKPAFAPGSPGRALYSDTNYQLLGRVIEETTGKSYRAVLESEILQPLELDSTWLYTDSKDDRPLPLRDGSRQLDIPMAMASFGPDGGIVSDVGDLMTFLRAFFEGRLFEPTVLPKKEDFLKIFFPLRYAVGVTLFRIPRFMSPFSAPLEFIGHSGLSGAFAFAIPENRTLISGTVNNLAKPSRAYKLMLRLASLLRSTSR